MKITVTDRITLSIKSTRSDTIRSRALAASIHTNVWSAQWGDMWKQGWKKKSHDYIDWTQEWVNEPSSKRREPQS